MADSVILSALSSRRGYLELTFKVSIRYATLVASNFEIKDSAGNVVPLEPFDTDANYNSITKTFQIHYEHLPQVTGQFSVSMKNLVRADGQTLPAETQTFSYNFDNTGTQPDPDTPVTIEDHSIIPGVFDLSFTSGTGSSESFRITDVDPASGSLLEAGAQSITVSFSHDVHEPSLDANVKLQRKPLQDGFTRWEDVDYSNFWLSAPRTLEFDLDLEASWRYRIILKPGLEEGGALDATPSARAKLGSTQTLEYGSEIGPLYIDIEEILDLYPDSTELEIALLVRKFSLEVDRLRGSHEIPYAAYEYIRAAVECALSRVHNGYGGSVQDFTLGDLRVSEDGSSNRTSREPSSPCELAAMLKDDMRRVIGNSRIRGVVAGARVRNPMPQRHLRGG